MDEPARSPASPSDRDDILLERLRDVARERDGVPDEVLAAARALFALAPNQKASAAAMTP
jgi:hypothetical protein